MRSLSPPARRPPALPVRPTVTLELLAALRSLAPKRRRARAPYVVTLALGVFVFVFVVSHDPTARAFGVAALRDSPLFRPLIEVSAR